MSTPLIVMHWKSKKLAFDFFAKGNTSAEWTMNSLPRMTRRSADDTDTRNFDCKTSVIQTRESVFS